MEIDVTEINEEMLANSNLPRQAKDFIRDVEALKKIYAQCIKAEIDGIIEKHSKILAGEIEQLYNKYIKAEAEAV